MSVCVYANSTDGGSEEKGKLEIVHVFPRTLDRWNTNEEAAKYLVSVDYHREWMSKEPAERPASGQMFIYDKREVKFKKDGYAWKRRKDGRTPREDHMRLKVFGVELLYGCYAHSADSPTFHRRSYWLLQKPDMVLVHYLDVPSDAEKSLNGISDTELLQIVMSKPCLVDKLRNQLQPVPAPLPMSIEQAVSASQPILSTVTSPGSHPNSVLSSSPPMLTPSPPMLARAAAHLLQHSPPVVQQAATSALDLSTFPDVQSLGVFDDVLHFGGECRDMSSLSPRNSASAPNSPQSFRHHGSLSAGDPLLHRSWPHLESPPAVRSSPGSVSSRHSIPSPPCIKISDFCPDWAYTEGGTKVVITGIIPENCDYGLGFGEEFVPATIVQSGVLRCFCPPHEPGLVQLQLYCNGVAVAAPAVFDYKRRETASPAHSQGVPAYKRELGDIQFLEPTLQLKQELPDPLDVSADGTSSILVSPNPGWHAPHNSLVEVDPLQPSSQMSCWQGPPIMTPPESESSFQAAVSATSSTTSVGSIFDDPGAPSVAEWCAILGDGRNVLQEDFNRLDLSDGEQQQLFFAASTIQTAFRRYRRKSKDLERRNSAALLIQNWYRHYKVTKKQEDTRERMQCQAETLAAMKIQRFLRRSVLFKKRIGHSAWSRSTSKHPKH